LDAERRIQGGFISKECSELAVDVKEGMRGGNGEAVARKRETTEA